MLLSMLFMVGVPLLIILCHFFWALPTRIQALEKEAGSVSTKEALGIETTELLSKYIVDRSLTLHSYRDTFIPSGLYLGLVGIFTYIAVNQIASTTFEDTVGLYRLIWYGIAAFFGAYLATVGHLFNRVIRKDLLPQGFLSLSRVLIFGPILAFPTMSLFMSLPNMDALESEAVWAIAFGVGLFFDRSQNWFESLWSKITGDGSAAVNDSLRILQGITRDDILRLSEVGIYSIQNLAFKNPIELTLLTPYSLEIIVDWQDQALLVLYCGEKTNEYRKLHMRGAIDITGAHTVRYDKATDLIKALAKKLDEPEETLTRLIDNLNKDPQVDRLWRLHSALSKESKKL